eukprot:Em0002g182a
MASVFIWVALFYVLVQQARSQCGAGSTDCKCLWTDPKTTKSYTLDISKLFTYPHTVISSDNQYDYEYDPCTTLQCGGSTTNVCQTRISVPTQQFNCGTNPVWSVSNSTYFVIRYTATSGGRMTTVTFIQDSKSGVSATSVVENPSSKYSFTVHFDSTEGGSSSGGSPVGVVGFILISLIFVALIAYFVIGAIMMYTLKGARGIEVIPNIGFWKDLPFLIKDGVLFMLSPCCGQKFSYTKM